jgi:hypothetical protein
MAGSSFGQKGQFVSYKEKLEKLPKKNNLKKKKF